jgi:hypothetical protein
VLFDYTLTSAWPSANVFNGIDNSPVNVVEWANKGTPGASARPNSILGLMEGNGGLFPDLLNLNNGMPIVAVVLNLAGQTTAQGPITIFKPWYQQLMRINYYLVVTAAGTAGTIRVQFLANDGTVTQTVVSSPATATTLGSMVQGSVMVNAAANSNVQWQVTFAGPVTGPVQYTLLASFERLN